MTHVAKARLLSVAQPSSVRLCRVFRSSEFSLFFLGNIPKYQTTWYKDEPGADSFLSNEGCAASPPGRRLQAPGPENPPAARLVLYLILSARDPPWRSFVAHFSHPFELELTSQTSPPHASWPVLYFVARTQRPAPTPPALRSPFPTHPPHTHPPPTVPGVLLRLLRPFPGSRLCLPLPGGRRPGLPHPPPPVLGAPRHRLAARPGLLRRRRPGPAGRHLPAQARGRGVPAEQVWLPDAVRRDGEGEGELARAPEGARRQGAAARHRADRHREAAGDQGARGAAHGPVLALRWCSVPSAQALPGARTADPASWVASLSADRCVAR